MSKIPKNRSDKEMMAGYVEESSLQEHFLKAEERERKKKKEEPEEAPANLARAGFTPQLTDELGKALLALKLELAGEGITKFTYKVKRDGQKIILTPKY